MLNIPTLTIRVFYGCFKTSATLTVSIPVYWFNNQCIVLGVCVY